MKLYPMLALAALSASLSAQTALAGMANYSSNNNSISVTWTGWSGNWQFNPDPTTTEYRVCWKVANAWVGACQANKSANTYGPTYTINGLAPGTSYKVRVEARGKHKVSGSIVWVDNGEAVITTTGSQMGLNVTSATSNSLDIYLWHYMQNFQKIRICYKHKNWITVPDLETRCTAGTPLWSANDKTKGYVEIAKNGDTTNYTLTGNISGGLAPSCPYKVSAAGYHGTFVFPKSFGSAQFSTSKNNWLDWFSCNGKVIVTYVSAVLDVFSKLDAENGDGGGISPDDGVIAGNPLAEREVSTGAGIGPMTKLTLAYAQQSQFDEFAANLARQVSKNGVLLRNAIELVDRRNKLELGKGLLAELAKEDPADQVLAIAVTGPRQYETWMNRLAAKKKGVSIIEWIEQKHGKGMVEQLLRDSGR